MKKKQKIEYSNSNIISRADKKNFTSATMNNILLFSIWALSRVASPLATFGYALGTGDLASLEWVWDHSPHNDFITAVMSVLLVSATTLLVWYPTVYTSGILLFVMTYIQHEVWRYGMHHYHPKADEEMRKPRRVAQDVILHKLPMSEIWKDITVSLPIISITLFVLWMSGM